MWHSRATDPAICNHASCLRTPRTAYYDSKGHLVTQRWRIAHHYLRTWFVLDVICVIPYDLITAGTMGFLSMLKVAVGVGGGVGCSAPP